MRRWVARPRCNATGTESRSLRVSTTSAASTATSVPAPTAMPTSAWASAGASFTPSPTMHTPSWRSALPTPSTLTREPLGTPLRCRDATWSALSCGSTWEMTLAGGMPTRDAIDLAHAALSPVNIQTDSPMLCSALMAAAASARGVSSSAAMPTTCPPSAANTTVLPSFSSRRARPHIHSSCDACWRAASAPSSSAADGRWRPCSRSRRRVPTATGNPPSVATTPRPGTVLKCDSSNGSVPALPAPAPANAACSLRTHAANTSSAFATSRASASSAAAPLVLAAMPATSSQCLAPTIALAMGCSEPFSTSCSTRSSAATGMAASSVPRPPPRSASAPALASSCARRLPLRRAAITSVTRMRP
mmetsp:Transcript_9075/g.28719  ORF Transcript_9075/g.28719 Transcript_9075/m.28719 type:complete len:362 (+) Transcript_9075:762-1847(+)